MFCSNSWFHWHFPSFLLCLRNSLQEQPGLHAHEALADQGEQVRPGSEQLPLWQRAGDHPLLLQPQAAHQRCGTHVSALPGGHQDTIVLRLSPGSTAHWVDGAREARVAGRWNVDVAKLADPPTPTHTCLTRLTDDRTAGFFGTLNHNKQASSLGRGLYYFLFYL